jgi:hypothetical protein
MLCSTPFLARASLSDSWLQDLGTDTRPHPWKMMIVKLEVPSYESYDKDLDNVYVSRTICMPSHVD